MINLKKISLKGTKVTQLPPSFFQVSTLEWLDLSETLLAGIPEELGRLGSLRYFAFSQPCPVAVWNGLIDLTHLHCSCPDFEVPGEFSRLAKLKELYLKSVSYAAFDSLNLPRLQTLEFKRSKNYTAFNLEGMLPNLKQLNTNYIEAFYSSIKNGALKGKPLKIVT